jgi:hypothetical protein
MTISEALDSVDVTDVEISTIMQWLATQLDPDIGAKIREAALDIAYKPASKPAAAPVSTAKTGT